MAAQVRVVTARAEVTRMVCQLEPGTTSVNTLSSANGPYVLLTLPGGDVSLLVTDQRALLHLSSACRTAGEQLRMAALRHESAGVA